MEVPFFGTNLVLLFCLNARQPLAAYLVFIEKENSFSCLAEYGIVKKNAFKIEVCLG